MVSWGRGNPGGEILGDILGGDFNLVGKLIVLNKLDFRPISRDPSRLPSMNAAEQLLARAHNLLYGVNCFKILEIGEHQPLTPVGLGRNYNITMEFEFSRLRKKYFSSCANRSSPVPGLGPRARARPVAPSVAMYFQKKPPGAAPLDSAGAAPRLARVRKPTCSLRSQTTPQDFSTGSTPGLR